MGRELLARAVGGRHGHRRHGGGREGAAREHGQRREDADQDAAHRRELGAVRREEWRVREEQQHGARAVDDAHGSSELGERRLAVQVEVQRVAQQQVQRRDGHADDLEARGGGVVVGDERRVRDEEHDHARQERRKRHHRVGRHLQAPKAHREPEGVASRRELLATPHDVERVAEHVARARRVLRAAQEDHRRGEQEHEQPPERRVEALLVRHERGHALERVGLLGAQRAVALKAEVDPHPTRRQPPKGQRWLVLARLQRQATVAVVDVEHVRQLGLRRRARGAQLDDAPALLQDGTVVLVQRAVREREPAALLLEGGGGEQPHAREAGVALRVRKVRRRGGRVAREVVAAHKERAGGLVRREREALLRRNRVGLVRCVAQVRGCHPVGGAQRQRERAVQAQQRGHVALTQLRLVVLEGERHLAETLRGGAVDGHHHRVLAVELVRPRRRQRRARHARGFVHALGQHFDLLATARHGALHVQQQLQALHGRAEVEVDHRVVGASRHLEAVRAADPLLEILKSQIGLRRRGQREHPRCHERRERDPKHHHGRLRREAQLLGRGDPARGARRQRRERLVRALARALRRLRRRHHRGLHAASA